MSKQRKIKISFVIILLMLFQTVIPISHSQNQQQADVPPSNNDEVSSTQIDVKSQLPPFTYNGIEYEYGDVPLSLQTTNLDKGLPSHLVAHNETQFDAKELTNRYRNFESTNFILNLGDLRIDFPATIEKINMSKISVIDEDYNIKPANLSQIYHIESLDNGDTGSVFLSETSVRGHFTIDEEIYELKPAYANGKFIDTTNYIFYKESNNQDLNSYYEESVQVPEDAVVSSSNKTRESGIGLDTVYTVHVVRAVSKSFYYDHGSNWAIELASIWDGAGSSDPKSALESELSIDFEIQYDFRITTSKPSSIYACTFLDEFKTVMNGLPSSHSAYNPDWGWIVSGHDFYSSTIGCAYPGTLNNGDSQYSANEAKNGAERMVRNSLMHEGGHVMINSVYNHHGDGEDLWHTCYQIAFYYDRTVMASPYMNFPYCTAWPYFVQRIFKFSDTNQAHAITLIAERLGGCSPPWC
ncbi:MAG: zinc-dependent metalloprotease family protein [Candidatus Kariarchaeaceae archaeon]|jgi:hypothetical protein